MVYLLDFCNKTIAATTQTMSNTDITKTSIDEYRCRCVMSGKRVVGDRGNELKLRKR